MYTGCRTLSYLTGLEIAGIVGAGLGGLGSAAAGIGSAVGGNALSKRKDVAEIAKLNQRLQHETMDYQNSIQIANYERQLADQYSYDAYNYKNYNSLEAQVKDAKNAGLAPEVVAGGASSGGVGGSIGASIGGVSIPGSSVDAVGYANAKEQQRQNGLRQIQGAFDTVTNIMPKLAQLGHEQAARNQQREVWKFENARNELELQERALDLTRKAFGNSKMQEKYDKWLQGMQFQANADKRQQEAHEMSMMTGRANYFGIIQDQNYKRDQHHMNMHQGFLQSVLTGENITEQRWRNDYMKKYGKYPEKSMSLADAIADALRGMSGDPSDSGNFVTSLRRRYVDSDGSFAYTRAAGDFAQYVLPWIFPYGKAFSTVGKGIGWLIRSRKASKALPQTIKKVPWNDSWDIPYTYID